MENLAIVGIFYDGYYDLWEDFLELKEKYWKDCPYPLYIVDNIKNLTYAKQYDVTVIHAGGDAEYSKRIQTALTQINADYYLLLLDDFFFGKNIEGACLDKYIKIMKENSLSYYAIPVCGFTGQGKGEKFNGMKGVYRISQHEEYTVSAQAAIWEKSFLAECIGKENYNAWIFEGIYCKSKKAHGANFLSKCVVDKNNVLGLYHGALQGKMLYSTVNYFKSQGYTMFNKRDVLSKNAVAKHLCKQKIKSLLPLSIQKVIKRMFNTNSVVERYKTEIDFQMKKLNME